MLALLVPGVHMGGGDGGVEVLPSTFPMRASMAGRTRMRTRYYPIAVPLTALLRWM